MTLSSPSGTAQRTSREVSTPLPHPAAATRAATAAVRRIETRRTFMPVRPRHEDARVMTPWTLGDPNHVAYRATVASRVGCGFQYVTERQIHSSGP